MFQHALIDSFALSLFISVYFFDLFDEEATPLPDVGIMIGILGDGLPTVLKRGWLFVETRLVHRCVGLYLLIGILIQNQVLPRQPFHWLPQKRLRLLLKVLGRLVKQAARIHFLGELLILAIRHQLPVLLKVEILRRALINLPRRIHRELFLIKFWTNLRKVPFNYGLQLTRRPCIPSSLRFLRFIHNNPVKFLLMLFWSF